MVVIILAVIFLIVRRKNSSALLNAGLSTSFESQSTLFVFFRKVAFYIVDAKGFRRNLDQANCTKVRGHELFTVN